MATASELCLEEELEALRQNAEVHKWLLDRIDPTTFVIVLQDKRASTLALFVRCDDYPSQPPAWHWYNLRTKAIDAPEDTPLGGNFFHGNGVICAPWNRLAYKSEDSRGPHDDWTIPNWMSVPETGGTRTLAAMADRIAHELRISYKRRMG